MNKMKRETVYREILYDVIERKRRVITQREVSKRCSVSVGLVSFALRPLRRMGSIVVSRRNFIVQDPWKILMYWCSIRNLQRYIIYSNFLRMNVQQIEASLPHDSIPTAYTAYRELFKDTPADYSEVYVYGKEQDFINIFGKENSNRANLFVLRTDDHLISIGKPTLAQIYVDLWNIGTWYARRFLTSLEARIKDILGES